MPQHGKGVHGGWSSLTQVQLDQILIRIEATVG